MIELQKLIDRYPPHKQNSFGLTVSSCSRKNMGFRQHAMGWWFLNKDESLRESVQASATNAWAGEQSVLSLRSILVNATSALPLVHTQSYQGKSELGLGMRSEEARLLGKIEAIHKSNHYPIGRFMHRTLLIRSFIRYVPMLSIHGLRRRLLFILPIGATPDSVNQNKSSDPPTNQTSLMRRQIPRDTIAQHTPGRIS